MFKLNEIKFYEDNDYNCEHDELISEIAGIDKEVIFDHINYVKLYFKNKKIFKMNYISNFDFSKNNIQIKSIVFYNELYNYYINNNSKIDKIEVVGMCNNMNDQRKPFYYKLIFKNIFNCKINELEWGLNANSEMKVVIK